MPSHVQILPEQLVCPNVAPHACKVAISPDDVKRCLRTQTERDRYDRLSLERCIEAVDDLASCPTAGCSFRFAWDMSNRKLECPLCHKSFCVLCRCEPWHRGQRCEEYRAAQGDAQAANDTFEAFAKRRSLKQCPKCKVRAGEASVALVL